MVGCLVFDDASFSTDKIITCFFFHRSCPHVIDSFPYSEALISSYGFNLQFNYSTILPLNKAEDKDESVEIWMQCS